MAIIIHKVEKNKLEIEVNRTNNVANRCNNNTRKTRYDKCGDKRFFFRFSMLFRLQTHSKNGRSLPNGMEGESGDVPFCR